MMSFLLFISSFALYVYCAYPSVSVGDSGEFITSAATLSIAHAPGYPLYALAAKCWMTLIPWAHAAYRVNLFSAAAGAAAIVLLYRVMRHVAVSRAVAGVCALAVAISVAFWKNAVASEVFALSTALALGVLLAALKERWWLCALLAGLALGNHQTLIFWFPGLALLYWGTRLSVKNVGGLLLFFMAGLTVYLVLLVRATHNPPLNYGDPDTLHKLWRVFTRADYGTFALTLGERTPRTLGVMGQHVWGFIHGMAQQISWIGVALSIFGFAWWFRSDRRKTLGVLLLALVSGPFFFILGNMPFDAQAQGVIERFYLLPLMAVVLGAAWGLEAIVARLPGSRLAVALVIGVGLVLWRVDTWATVFQRSNFLAYDYARNNLRTLPPGAVFMMDGGDDTFYTLATQVFAEGDRRDLALHDRGGVVFQSPYGRDYRRLPKEVKEVRRQQVEHAFLSTGHRLYYSTMNNKILPGADLFQKGFLYEAKPFGKKKISARKARKLHQDLFPLYAFRGVPPWTVGPPVHLEDYRTRALLPFYPFQRGMLAMHQQAIPEALAFFDRAEAVGSDVLWVIPNISVQRHQIAFQAMQSGKTALAKRVYEQLLAKNPRDEGALTNRGAIAEREGQLLDAERYYLRAIAAKRTSVNARYNLAVIFWRQKKWEAVVEQLEWVVAIRPTHTEAQRYLAQAKARLRR